MTTRIPTETGLLLIIQKNCRTKFSNFSLIFDYKKTKGPRVHDRCCFFPNLKPFSVVVSWIRQEKSASQLCFSWLRHTGCPFWGSWRQHNTHKSTGSSWPMTHSNNWSFLDIIFFSEKRLALPPGSEQSSLGLVGPRTHLEQKEGTKQTLKRRMSNNCSTQAKCLETNFTWKTLFFRQASLPSAATQPISPRQTQQRLTLKLPALRQLPWKSSWFWRWRSIFCRSVTEALREQNKVLK